MNNHDRKYDYIFFTNVNRLLSEKKLTLSALAKLSGLSISLLSGIKNKTGNPSLQTMEKIAIGLDVSLVYLLTEH